MLAFRRCAAWSLLGNGGESSTGGWLGPTASTYKGERSIRSDTGRTGLVRQNTAASGRFITDLRNHPHPFVDRRNLARSSPDTLGCEPKLLLPAIASQVPTDKVSPTICSRTVFVVLPPGKKPTIRTLAGFIPGRSVSPRVGSRGGKRAQAPMADRIIRLISKRSLYERYSEETSAAIDDCTAIQVDREEYNSGCLCGDLQWI